MNQGRNVIDQLKARKRVDVTPKDYLTKLKIKLYIAYTVVLLLNGLLFLKVGVNYTSLILCLISTVFFAGFFREIIRHSSTTAVKGDTLILNNDKRKHCVTSLRSIKKIRTISFLFFKITHLTYKVDGKTSFIIIISKYQAFEISPEGLLRTAMELSKKQKANHKPGPVAV